MANTTYRPLHLAADGITIVQPHPQAVTEFAKQQGYIIARCGFAAVEGQPTEEARAYARLFVAAPTMLDALRNARIGVFDTFARFIVDVEADAARVALLASIDGETE
jgi:hypothetical protein